MKQYHCEKKVSTGTKKPEAIQAEQKFANEKSIESSYGVSEAGKPWTKPGLGKLVKEGLLATVVELGLTAVHKLFEEEVTELVGQKGIHNQLRGAVRHGYEDGEVTLGGRRIPLRHPRIRSSDKKQEISLPTYQQFASRDMLGEMARERMLSGLSTRKYAVGLEPISARQAHRARGISKSVISRRFIELTKTALEEFMGANLAELKAVAIMIDGVHVAGQMCVVALAIDVDGHKHPVGIIEGATENKRVVTDLLVDLVDRGLDSSHGLLFVIDGAKALAAGVRAVFGEQAVIQRCIEHKIRNVLDYLHQDEKRWVNLKLRLAWKRIDADAALKDLNAIVKRLEETNLDAARSLREGMHETLTIQRLGVGQILSRTLRTTNAIESMFEIVRAKQRNVKHWKAGDMRLRWATAGMLEAESQFRKVAGRKELPALARSLYHFTTLKPQVDSQVA